jgi:hypothetical protein
MNLLNILTKLFICIYIIDSHISISVPHANNTLTGTAHVGRVTKELCAVNDKRNSRP